MDEATNTELILYEGVEKVRQLMGDSLKAETIVHLCQKISSFTSPFF